MSAKLCSNRNGTREVRLKIDVQNVVDEAKLWYSVVANVCEEKGEEKDDERMSK
jgi:hypothetical protein